MTNPKPSIFAPGPAYIVAEIGINHNGDMNIAERLVDAALEAGANCVKFQMRTPETSVPASMRDIKRQTPWGPMTYLQYRHRMELSTSDLAYLETYATKRSLHISASVWDMPALNRFKEVFPDAPFIKIPSAQNHDIELVKAVATSGPPIIVSTGFMTEQHFPNLARLLEPFDACYMHAVGAYPAPFASLHLGRIKRLRQAALIVNAGRVSDDELGRKSVGYSSHDLGIAMPVVAAALGCQVIEKHITLDRTMWGSDHAASLEPSGFAKMVRDIRHFEVANRGHNEAFKVLDVEQEKLTQLRK